jgi:hypothetical protein
MEKENGQTKNRKETKTNILPRSISENSIINLRRHSAERNAEAFRKPNDDGSLRSAPIIKDSFPPPFWQAHALILLGMWR